MKIINGLTDETNMPGLALLLFVPVASSGQLPFPDPTNHQGIDVSAITLSHPDFSKWIPLYHTIDTGVLMEEADSNDQGPLYKYAIECVVPKDYSYRQSQFDTLLQMEHLVITRDHNNVARILGYTEDGLFNRGALMKWKFTTGKGSKDRNGYSLSFYFESNKKALPALMVDALEVESSYFV